MGLHVRTLGGNKMKPVSGVRLLMVMAGIFCCNAASAVSPGMTDTFQNGSTEGWSTGAPSPNPPSNIPSGGPGGGGDRYLLLTSTGGGGPGSRLVAISGVQWAGDYLSAGVSAIRMDVKNFGSTDLSLRLYFEGPLDVAYSSDAVLVHAGSNWAPATFSILGNALSGGPVLSGVTQFRLFHSVLPGAPSNGAAIVAQLGIDNVTAVPEPAEWLAMLAGMAVLLTASAAARRRTARA